MLILLLIPNGVPIVGHYNAAYQVALCTVFPPRLVVSTLFPAVAQMSALGEHEKVAPAIRRVTGFIAIAVVPIVFGGLALRERILGTVFPPEFADAATVLSVLIVAYGINALMYPFTAALLGLGRPREITLNVVPMALAIATLHLTLIPRYGMNGAAFGAGMPIAVFALAFPWQTARCLRRAGCAVRATDLLPWGVLARSVAAAAAMAVTVWRVQIPGGAAALLGTIALGAAVYALLFFVVLRGLPAEDRALLASLRGGGRRT